ncbi:MAG: hypothetical protein NDJ89_05280 [Oligoflexia bacterium]|nr:hypothetical protein [Oligoflexia bacterium]
MRKILGASVLVAFAIGCTSLQNQNPIENALQSLKGTTGKPYVEAYIEYTGPADKWAGPATFLMHVVAKDSGPAVISIVPPLFGDAMLSETTRAPASADPKTSSGDAARERLTRLAGELQGDEPSFRGCLSPVRVRLLRSDGALLEKQGCRGTQGWPKAVSDTVSYFISSLGQS